MSITGTMYRGLSGLNASGASIQVTGDNIANVNTVGHRASRAQFEDVLNRSIMGVGQLGGGVRMAKIEKMFHQGAIVDSPRSSDMAINGRGFFVLRGNHNGVEGSYYSRAGQFKLDDNGLLSNMQGLRVQGYSADANGVISTQLGDLQLDQNIPPNPTSEISMEIAFDGNPQGALVPGGFVLGTPASTTFQQELTVYDSMGTAHQVQMHFTRIDQTNWEWNMVGNGAEMDPQVAGQVVLDSGTVVFNTDGTLNTSTQTGSAMDFLGATANQTVAFDFTGSGQSSRSTGPTVVGAVPPPNQTDVIGITNNGYSSGSFVDIGLEADGTIVGRYDNGRSLTIGRMALADFRSEDGLESVGGTMFTANFKSGDALIGFAGTGGRGMIRGNALEQSNVDLSNEFVRMITDQRAYQATAKTITTADELLVETVNLKR